MLTQDFSFVLGKRKYLFCADREGMEYVLPLHRACEEKKLPVDWVDASLSTTELEAWLSRQKMGSYLYLSGSWQTVSHVREIAQKAGFTEDDMQCKGVGPKLIQVMCSKCHGINPAFGQTKIICRHCFLPLEVSEHYSRRLDAYLGYMRRE